MASGGSGHPAPARREWLVALRVGIGYSQEALAEAAQVDRSTVGRWERGEATPRPLQRRQLAEALQVSLSELAQRLGRSGERQPSAEMLVGDGPQAIVANGEASENRREFPAAAAGLVTEVGGSGGWDRRWFPYSDRGWSLRGLPDLDALDRLRSDLHDVLSPASVSDDELDDWEQAALEYGRATRHRPLPVLQADLSVELAELQDSLQRCRSASASRRLTRVGAQMCGLMLLTLVKLDERARARAWAHTARTAAVSAGDPVVLAWVLAQEAYGHYYCGHLDKAIVVARRAQEVGGKTSGAGGPLAAALEARAHASLGRHLETSEALARAEAMVGSLEGEALAASAFGYNEAQLRFHEGSAYTQLRDLPRAFAAQDRALELCAPGDYTDWALTRLDRAACLAGDGDVTDAMSYAGKTISDLTDGQRVGLITRCGYNVLGAVPIRLRALPAVREFEDLLVQTTRRGAEVTS